MGIYLNPGNDRFRKMLRSKIYVDKSELMHIQMMFMDSEMAYICVSRPRRFGKSVAANMLCAYYTKGCDSESLFQNQRIAANPTFREHLNQYNVLLLNIQHFIREAKIPENLIKIMSMHQKPASQMH